MSNKTVNETTKILLDARELIKSPESWIRGEQMVSSILDNGKVLTRYCILGAIAARGNNFYKAKAVHTFMKANDVNLRTYVHPVAYWNDAGERTHEQVMEAMDKAIEFSLKEKANVE